MSSVATAQLLQPDAERSSLGGKQSLVLISLLAVAIAAGQVSLFYAPNAGVYITTLALALVMALSTRTQAQARAVITSTAVIPLLSLVNLSIVQQSAFSQTAILYIPMLILGLIYSYIFRQKTEKIQDNRHLRFYIVGIVGSLSVGAAIGALCYLLLKGAYVFEGINLQLVFAVAAVGALAEEFLFRGLILRHALEITRPIYAVLFTTLLYGTLSLSHFSNWSLPLGLLTAAVLSTLYAKTHNLVLTITLNMASKFVYLGLIAKYLLH